jgi:sortase A
MKFKLGNICIALGILSLLAALSLFVYNQKESSDAGKASEEVLETIENDYNISPQQSVVMPELYKDKDMPSVTVDNNEYIGYISIPSVGIYLPIMKEWSYDGLRISPCRFSGSLYTDDMIIAGHNYITHFGPISSVSSGDSVTITDVDGNVWNYAVLGIDVIDGADIDSLMAKSDVNDWDLTLFTCTLSGTSRYAVRCYRVS